MHSQRKMFHVSLVTILSLGLLLIGWPVRAKKRSFDTYDCYPVGGGNICAAIHYDDDGVEQYANFYASSDDGFAMATWQAGIGAEVTYMQPVQDGNPPENPGGSTAALPVVSGRPDGPECRQCIDLQTRLCYDVWRSEDQDAATTTAGSAFLCLGFFTVTPVMVACMGGSLLNGLAKRRAANNRLNLCLIQGYRTCFDPQGRSCWP